MSGLSIILIIFEIVIAFAVVWAVMNEDFFIKVENRVFERIVAAVRSRRVSESAAPSVQNAREAALQTVGDDEFAKFSPFVA